MQTTAGTLLGGRVPYVQPTDGYRTGIEPVLLAASIPAQPGQRVLEAGTGAAAGLLCLAVRVPNLIGLGIEKDPAMAALARQNLKPHPTYAITESDLAQWAPPHPFDHAFANPPWHDPAGTPSPTARRRLAKTAEGLPLEGWTAALAAALRPGGTATILLPAAQLTRLLAAMQAAALGRRIIVPLWPKPGRDAKLILVQATAARAGPDRLTQGLILHQPNGTYTPEAEAILRHGASLPIGPFSETPAIAPPPPSCPPPARSN